MNEFIRLLRYARPHKIKLCLAILAMLLLPAGAVYWWGFALPFGPIFALTRTFLIIQRWTRLS